MRRMYVPIGLVSVATALIVSGCMGSGLRPTVSQLPTSSSPVTARTSQAPPATSVAAVPTGTPAATTSASTDLTMSLFYVKVGDKGKSGEVFGCQDSLVRVPTRVTADTSGSTVADAFAALLADHEQAQGEPGLYNALWLSQLSFDGATVNQDIVTVYLSGTLVSAGVCDDPRIVMQLTRTATVAAGRAKARVLINDIPVGVLLDGRGH